MFASLYFSIKGSSAYIHCSGEAQPPPSCSKLRGHSILRRGSCIAVFPWGLCAGTRGRRCSPWLAAASPAPPSYPLLSTHRWDGMGKASMGLHRQMSWSCCFTVGSVLMGWPVAAWWELEMLSFIICLSSFPASCLLLTACFCFSGSETFAVCGFRYF